MKIDKPCPHCGGSVEVDAIAHGGVIVRVDAQCKGCGAKGSASVNGVPPATIDTVGLGPHQLALIAAHATAFDELCKS